MSEGMISQTCIRLISGCRGDRARSRKLRGACGHTPASAARMSHGDVAGWWWAPALTRLLSASRRGRAGRWPVRGYPGVGVRQGEDAAGPAGQLTTLPDPGAG